MKIERILKGICVIALIVIAVSTAIIALDTLNPIQEERDEKKEVTYANNIDKTPKEGEKINFQSLVAPPDFVLETQYGETSTKDKGKDYQSFWKSIFS